MRALKKKNRRNIKKLKIFAMGVSFNTVSTAMPFHELLAELDGDYVS